MPSALVSLVQPQWGGRRYLDIVCVKRNCSIGILYRRAVLFKLNVGLLCV